MMFDQFEAICKFPTYVGLGIIQAILLFISASEHMHGSLSPEKAKSCRMASNFAFVGMLCTLAIGIATAFSQNIELLFGSIIIPFIFIVLWAKFYLLGSKNVDRELLEEEAITYYKQLIINCMQKDTYNDEDELFKKCNERMRGEISWQGAVNIALSHVPRFLKFARIDETLDKVLLNRQQFDALLLEIKKDKKR